jgi:hypothetical protein
MKWILRRLSNCVVVFGLVFSAASLLAADVVVTRKTNLRSDPSASHKPIRVLDPDEELQLVEEAATANNYVHVRTEDGTEGYVYGRNLKVLQPTSGSAGAAGASPSVPTPGAVVGSIPRTWDKPAPVALAFDGSDGVCPPGGDGGDQETNLRKNRTDVPAAYHDVDWSAVATLEYPVAKPSLVDWTADEKAQIAPYEGIAVRTIGYLVAIKPQTSSTGESTNCHFRLASEVDWHIALVAGPGDGEKTSVVVETTPRVRASHPNWSPAALSDWLNSDKPVRISGWLLLDPEHRNHLGKYRSTLWEIHPITRIEVMKDGSWVDLDR